MKISKLLRLPLAALIAGLGCAQAGDVVLYRQGERPDPGEVARILSHSAADEYPEFEEPIRTRGIKLLTEERTQPRANPPRDLERVAAARSAEATAFALQIQFPFNSARVQPDMFEALDAVGEGIKLAGHGVHIVLEGHTDAAGSANYNLILSRRRAEAVKNYLVWRHAIPASTFRVVGMGEAEPLFPEDPLAPENRRVQFRPA